jgi:Icc-related predicted phosphoesterase
MKIFFATDIHGSNICFKKLLNAGKFYGADLVILGGDMTGKMVIPILKSPKGIYTSNLLEQKFTLKTEVELKNYIENISNMGLYPYLTNEDEILSLQNNKLKSNEIFKSLIIQRLTEWVTLADTKLQYENMKLYVCPGNDDDYYIDEILKRSNLITNLENSVIDLFGKYELLSTGHSNLTPWHTPREIPEEQLEDILQKLNLKVNKNKGLIVDIHVPPYNSRIDEAAELDSEFRVVTSLGQLKKKPVGSIAVRKFIEENQPIVGLFGHIHEGKGQFTIGKTICINPGSNYQEGVLNGCLLHLENNKVVSYQFVTG